MTKWHTDVELLSAYRDGLVDDALSYSVEAHLVRCAPCRRTVSLVADVDRLEEIWRGVVVETLAPRPKIIERLLLRWGFPDHVARLLAATPSLRTSWIASVAAALGFAVGAAHGGRGGILLFLVLAPLLPVAGVAAAYGPGMDPTYEIGLAAPIRSFRLLLIRATAVLASTTLLAGVAALFLPRLDWTVVAWMLPSLGLTVTSLALATVFSPLISAGAVAGGWVALTTLAAVAARDELVAFRGAAQAAFAALALAAALVTLTRRRTFDTRRTR